MRRRAERMIAIRLFAHNLYFTNDGREIPSLSTQQNLCILLHSPLHIPSSNTLWSKNSQKFFRHCFFLGNGKRYPFVTGKTNYVHNCRSALFLLPESFLLVLGWCLSSARRKIRIFRSYLPIIYDFNFLYW